jgi:hypothetical protein
MANSESFFAGLGHAASVSRAARQISEMEIGTGWTWREVKEDIVMTERVQSEQFGRVLRWAGDYLILIGTWLKARSGQTSYQQA